MERQLPRCPQRYFEHVFIVCLVHCISCNLKRAGNHSKAFLVCCNRYKPFLVAEVQLNEPGSQNGDGVDPVEADKASAFKQLAGFLGEKNERGQKLSMTTPVFNKSKQGVMQFYIGEGYKVKRSQPMKLFHDIVWCTELWGKRHWVAAFCCTCRFDVMDLLSCHQSQN